MLFKRCRLLTLVGLVILLSLLPASVTFAQDTLPPDLTGVYEAVSPSIVAISVTARQPQTGFQTPDGEVVGAGSGFVIDEEGHIVTNNHVVDGATRIEVNFLDGTLARAEVIGLDPDSDLAVIKVELPPEKLYPVEWADSDMLEIGQPVVAIGSPFGQRWTLTSGIISALDRTIQGLTNFSIGGVIQTDASINPGNSGGPLLDLQGHVVGVNSQIISATRSSAGIGFAIPSNLTKKVSQALIEDGFVNYSFLGIGGSDMSLTLIEALELPSDTRGVVVGTVEPGGPAARAGLQASGNLIEFDGQQVPTTVDIITSINGTPLTGIGSLITYLAKNTEPGDEVVLTVLRNGEETLELPVRLTPRR